MHGMGTEAARASKRTGPGTGNAGCTYLHAALGGRPPISRASGSDIRVTFDQPPEPLDTLPQQLTFEEFVEPTS